MLEIPWTSNNIWKKEPVFGTMDIIRWFVARLLPPTKPPVAYLSGRRKTISDIRAEVLDTHQKAGESSAARVAGIPDPHQD